MSLKPLAIGCTLGAAMWGVLLWLTSWKTLLACFAVVAVSGPIFVYVVNRQHNRNCLSCQLQLAERRADRKLAHR